MSIDVSVLNQIAPEHIEQYLLFKGWKRHRIQPEERTLIYNSPKVKYAQIEIPLEKGIYYPQSVYNIIQHLAELERRDEKYVCEDLQFHDCEIIRYRLISSQTTDGTIPIGIGSDCLDAIIELLQNVLNDVVASKSNRKVENIRDKILLDQTERGSYVVKVVCPLHAISISMLPLDNVNDTVMRMATKHMMRTSSDIISAIDCKKLGQFIDKVTQKTYPISAKFCNVLSKIQLSDDGTVDLNIRWASSLEMTENIPDKVHIAPKHFEGISEIVHALNSKDNVAEPPRTERFIAVVDICQGGYNKEGLREGPVILKIFSTEGKAAKAKAVLPHKLYMIAHDNHGQNKGNFLEIVGKRIMKGKMDEIIDVETISPLIKK